MYASYESINLYIKVARAFSLISQQLQLYTFNSRYTRLKLNKKYNNHNIYILFKCILS